ncbi:cytochrome P450 3A24-like [Halichondria panicea]|uniref:cytochrome P450 3A24-like n=1 Tax=Halichondria panicea TaxID=6063 RepID=UPI00312B82DC
MLAASVCGITLLLLLYWIYKVFWAPFQVFKRLGIKGPKPELILGNSRLRQKIGLIKFLSLLYNDYGPISGFYFGIAPQLVIFDLDILKQVLVKEFDSFMDRPIFPDLLRRKRLPRGLLLTRGEAWKTSRRTLTPTFSAAKMKMMVPLIENSAQGLLKRMGEIAESGQSADVFKVFGSFTMETIIATAFGRVIDIQGGENDELTNAADLIFRGTAEGNKTSAAYVLPLINNFPWLVPVLRFLISRSKRGLAMETLQDTALSLINERRKSSLQGNYKDMLQLMIDATVDEEGEQSCPVGGKKLTNEQIVGLCTGFFLAGYETTANTLSYTAYLLALHPEVQEKLQRDIDSYMEDNPDAGLYEASQEITYLDLVVQESLRLYPPAPMILRLCNKTITINDLTIPKGVSVAVPIAHLHKDPQYWEEPDKFIPERFTSEEKAKRPQLCYMPFGHGPRNCIGMRFAMLEAKLALIEVLRKFSFVRAPDTEVPLETVVGITMAPKNGVFVKVIPRD